MLSPRASRPAFGTAALCLAVMVIAAAAAPARVIERSVEYPGSEGEMPARLYVPAGPGPYPGVLVLHTIAGPGPMLEDFARRLSAEGFVTMTPDLFALHEFGAEGRVDHPLVLKDLAAALTFLRAQPAVDRARLGVVGFSFGGRLAVLAAATYPDLKAAVVYYAVTSFQELAKTRPVGGRALHSRPTTELVGSIRAPVQLHHGAADRSVPADQSRLLHESLTAAGRASTLFVYPGADHLFNAPPGSDGHHPEAAALSWDRTLRFLKEHLVGGPPARG